MSEERRFELRSRIAFFSGIDAIEDILVRVKTPDVLMAQTTLQS